MKTSVPGNKKSVIPAVLSLVFIFATMFAAVKSTKLSQLKLSTKQLEKYQMQLETENRQEIQNKRE